MSSNPNPILCSHCAKVNLNPDCLLSWAHLGLISWSLGSLERVKRSTCPLCRIVLLSLQRHHQAAQASKRISPEDVAVSDADEVKLHWFAEEGPSRQGAFTVTDFEPRNFICFTADSKRPRSTNTLHRNDWASIAYLHSEVKPEFDIGRLQTWIECCDRFHCVHENWSCSSTRQGLDLRVSSLSTLRLVDVQRKCIIEYSGDGQDTAVVPRYVALSYMWGGVPTVRLTRVNKSTLMQSDGLQAAWDLLPRTIRDAVVLVQKLGLEYLWIDSLCLVQDDDEDMKLGVNSMDMIYTKAWLTIVAAHGHNADAGLPGMSWTSRVLDDYIVKVTEDASVGLFERLDVALDRTVYSTRAWTCQEQLLSNRTVYFLSNQIFFRCNGYLIDALSERMTDPDSLYYLLAEGPRTISLTVPMATKFRNVGISRPNPHPLSKSDVLVFCELLQEYMRRCLTYPDDVLRAMEGIMRFYEQRAAYTFLEGMPTGPFDAFALFQSDGCALRRRRGYPSYSWAGWTGRIRFSSLDMDSDHVLDGWLNDSCPVSWHVIGDDESTPSTPIWKPGLWEKVCGPRRQLLEKWIDRLCNSTQAGASTVADETPDQDNLLSAETADNSRQDTSPLPLVQRSSMQHIQYKVLHFWAISVYLRIEQRNILTGTVWIVAENGEKVGVAWVDGTQDTALVDPSTALKFILISAAPSLVRTELTAEEARVLGNKTYNVLLLECSGPVSERRGVGLLSESGVRKSVSPGPRLGEIILA